jgi:hypothetical protein
LARAERPVVLEGRTAGGALGLRSIRAGKGLAKKDNLSPGDKRLACLLALGRPLRVKERKWADGAEGGGPPPPERAHTRPTSKRGKSRGIRAP